MRKHKYLFLLLTVLTLSSCQTKEYFPIPTQIGVVEKINLLSDERLKDWHLKDIQLDSLPGVSLYRAYDSLLVGKKGKEVIVAILDTKLDIHHEDLKGQLWINKNEIPNNNIDDDDNGYIDDINGWNFLGNSNNEDLLYQKYSYLRVVEKYEAFFKGKKVEDLSVKDSLLYQEYMHANKVLEVKSKKKDSDLAYAVLLLNILAESKKEMLKYFSNDKYTLKDLDSLSNLHSNNKKLQNSILRRSNFMKYGYTKEYLKEYELSVFVKYKKMLNKSYREREIQGDDPEKIKDAFYGNNILFGVVPFKHAIGVSGLLGATRNNNIGLDGFSNYIKIMPVVMVASGDEHDKDVALAIRYAVDNGAQIINMSWGKYFSLHSDWVIDAMKYAENKGVLLVTGSGNDAINNDVEKIYPDDNINGKEFLTNFISVGATEYNVNAQLKSSFSNYGNENVDVFAPGNNLYTTATNSTYQTGGGTSYASPIIAGVAALIWSYYPSLTVSEVKKIILDSGVKYDLIVNIGTEEKKELVPFSTLSKSGKIVNAYNALIMAEKISNKN